MYIFNTCRLKSVGFDMLKQRGKWQAAGIKPVELGLEFDSMFTHEIEDMSEILVRKSEMTEVQARQFLSTTFQVRLNFLCNIVQM